MAYELKASQVLPIGVLVGGTLLIARRYIELNPEIARQLPAHQCRYVPLLVVVIVAAACCLVQVSCIRSDQNERGADRGLLHMLLLVALVVWVGGVALSALIDEHPSTFAFGEVGPYLLGATVFLVTYLSRPTFDQLRRVVTVVALLGALTIILDAAGVWTHGATASLRRPRGFFFNRNYAGEYLAIALPFYLPQLSRRHLYWLLIPLGLALAWTRCRTAWLGASLACACLLVLCCRQHRKSLALGCAAYAFGMFLAALVPSRLSWRESRPYRATAARVLDVRSGSGALRVREYIETIDLLTSHLAFGLGPGRWHEEIASRDIRLAANLNPHSDYLRALADGGIPTACGLLALFFVVGWAGWRQGSASMASFVLGFAVTSLADCPLYRIETLTLAFAAFGVTASAMTRRPDASWTTQLRVSSAESIEMAPASK